jgi:hypothetical protein
MKRTEALHLKIRGYIRNLYDCVQYTKLGYCVESIASVVILFLLLELHNTKFATGSYLYFIIIVILRANETLIVCVPYIMQMPI